MRCRRKEGAQINLSISFQLNYREEFIVNAMLSPTDVTCLMDDHGTYSNRFATFTKAARTKWYANIADSSA